MPVQEVKEAATVASSFNWPQVTAVLGGISMFLTFMGTILWKYWDSTKSSSSKESEERKDKEVRDTLEKLTREYEVLRVQVDNLRQDLSRIDAGTAKEVEKLESKIDKLIEMMIKLISEDE